MQMMLLACAVGAIGGIMAFWYPDSAYWVNIAGIALFLAGFFRWLTGGSARNWKTDTDVAFPPASIDGMGADSASCGGESGCDGGGDGGGGD